MLWLLQLGQSGRLAICCDVTIYFSDGLKKICGVSTGVFSIIHSVVGSYGSPGFASEFQATVWVILDAYRWLGHDLSLKRKIIIVPHNQVAIKGSLLGYPCYCVTYFVIAFSLRITSLLFLLRTRSSLSSKFSSTSPCRILSRVHYC